MFKLKRAMEYVRRLCCICWNDHYDSQPSDISRLSHMRELKERDCTCLCPDHTKHTLKRIFPLHRHLKLNSELTRDASNHWLWRGQEEYLDWKQQTKEVDTHLTETPGSV